MKKGIIVFAALALVVLAAAPASAAVRFTLNDSDDSVFAATANDNHNFNFVNNDMLMLKSDLSIVSRTGGNTQLAGGDMGEDSPVTIATGEANIDAVEAYDSGTDLTLSCGCEGEGGADVEVTANDSDDSVVAADDTNNDNTNIVNNSAEFADLDTEVVADAGGNTQAAADDLDAGSISTGATNILFTRQHFHVNRFVK